MAEVILVQPKIGLLDNIKSAPGLPISLLTSVKLVAKKYKVKLIDQRIDRDWEKSLAKELAKKPLVVGTTAMLGPQIKYAVEIGNFVKKHNPRVAMVIGGPCASVLPIQALESGAFDVVLKGDGEETFLKLISELYKKRKKINDGIDFLKKIKGLYIRNKFGKIIFTGEAPLVDLNKMPDVPYELVNVYDYLPKRGGEPTIDMETSRGCPYSCRFCYNPIFNSKRWRAYKPELLLESVKKLKDKYGIKSVWFIDDEFFINLKRAEVIIRGLKNIGIRWTIQGVTAKSILSMNNRYLKMLVESGCEQINIGAESGSNRILKNTKKGILKRDIIKVNNKLKPFSIMPWYYFMVGFPGETSRERKMTIKLIIKLLEDNKRAKISGIGCYTPYPGTELFDEAKKYGYKPPKHFIDWSDYAVDRINVPWLKGRVKSEVSAIQFASFFVDQKVHDVTGYWWVSLIASLYRPIAKFRFKNHYYGLPLDIFVGNLIKGRFSNI